MQYIPIPPIKVSLLIEDWAGDRFIATTRPVVEFFDFVQFAQSVSQYVSSPRSYIR